MPMLPLEWAGAQVTDFGEGLKTDTRCFKDCIATVASIVNAVVWCCMRTALRFGRGARARARSHTDAHPHARTLSHANKTHGMYAQVHTRTREL